MLVERNGKLRHLIGWKMLWNHHRNLGADHQYSERWHRVCVVRARVQPVRARDELVPDMYAHHPSDGDGAAFADLYRFFSHFFHQYFTHNAHFLQKGMSLYTWRATASTRTRVIR